jgi:hypothetical protein
MADGNGEQLTLNQRLHVLMEAGLALPMGHPQRRVLTNRIVRLIQRSGKLWRASGSDAEFYEDALMLTWRHFWRNLWVADTAVAYCEPDCVVMSRLNTYLRMRVQDLAVAARAEAKQRANPRLDGDSGEWIDPIEQVAAPTNQPDLRSAVDEWLEQDETLQQVYVRGKPEITVAWLIREYLLADRKWKEVSVMAGVPISTLSSFYDRECRSRLQVFCRDEGYC